MLPRSPVITRRSRSMLRTAGTVFIDVTTLGVVRCARRFFSACWLLILVLALCLPGSKVEAGGPEETTTTTTIEETTTTTESPTTTSTLPIPTTAPTSEPPWQALASSSEETAAAVKVIATLLIGFGLLFVWINLRQRR